MGILPACSFCCRRRAKAAFPVILSMAASATAAHDLSHGGEAQPPPGSWIHENGIGPDPDGDGNPATNAYAFAHIGDPVKAAEDPLYTVITFEPPPGENGAAIRNEYAKKFGVTFGPGLTQQVCKGQRYNRFDSVCTYLAPPSGDFVAAYRDDFYRPLKIAFARPVCAVSLAIYPTGGEEDETFEATLQAFDANGGAIDKSTTRFAWSQNTFRWRVMKAAHFAEGNAARIEISLKSIKYSSRNIRFLIDDFAFANDGCNAAS